MYGAALVFLPIAWLDCTSSTSPPPQPLTSTLIHTLSFPQELLQASDMLEGYSQATLDSRAELLDVAKADVIGSKSQSIAERQHSITVPYHLVPGALAVLVEVRTCACRSQPQEVH